jgi:hypothetical protein
VQEREELQEYHYYTSGMEMTAMMTPKMAARLGAKPIDEPLDDPDQLENNEANRVAADNKDANARGVTVKGRTGKNKTASTSSGTADTTGSGPTGSQTSGTGYSTGTGKRP